MERVLVLMSTYNGEAYIRQQINSIMKQVDCDVHLLIRDDGSSDRTEEIINKYCFDNPNVHLSTSSGENLGPANSFLKLIDEAIDFDYYAFADQDDIWDTDKLVSATRRLKDCVGPALYCCNARLVDSDDKSLNRLANRNGLPTDYKSAIMGCGYLGCTMVFNSELVEIIHKHRGIRRVLMHDQYVACTCAINNGAIIYDNAPHMDYRQHGSNAVGVSSSKNGALRYRLKMLTVGNKISVAETAKVCLDEYKDLDNEQVKFAQTVASYKDKTSSRFRLAFIESYSIGTKNMTILMRLMVLLRKA